MNLPLISVITITYNAAGVLPPTLKSLRAQTFRNFEHIIVDGASSDDTLAVARAQGLPDARIVSEPDGGLYDAMNKGMAMARGKYLLFLNAGDALAQASTLADYARAAEEADADIVYGDTMIVAPDGKIIGPRHHSAPEVLTFKSFAKGMLICHQAFMMRRSLAPRYDLSYRFSADYDWCVRCISLTTPAKCVNLHRVAIHYLSDGLTDRNKIASLRERFRIMQRHYGTLKALSMHAMFIPRAIGRRFRRSH